MGDTTLTPEERDIYLRGQHDVLTEILRRARREHTLSGWWRVQVEEATAHVALERSLLEHQADHRALQTIIDTYGAVGVAGRTVEGRRYATCIGIPPQGMPARYSVYTLTLGMTPTCDDERIEEHACVETLGAAVAHMRTLGHRVSDLRPQPTFVLPEEWL